MVSASFNVGMIHYLRDLANKLEKGERERKGKRKRKDKQARKERKRKVGETERGKEKREMKRK